MDLFTFFKESTSLFRLLFQNTVAHISYLTSLTYSLTLIRMSLSQIAWYLHCDQTCWGEISHEIALI